MFFELIRHFYKAFQNAMGIRFRVGASFGSGMAKAFWNDMKHFRSHRKRILEWRSIRNGSFRNHGSVNMVLGYEMIGARNRPLRKSATTSG